MIKVQFPLVKTAGTNTLVYPDSRSLFSNTNIEGSTVYAEYSGALNLTSADKVWRYTTPLIRTRYFMRRFTSAERKLARDSIDDTVIDLMEDLRANGSVDLTDAITVAAIDYLITALPMASARKWVILADGTEQEKYVK